MSKFKLGDAVRVLDIPLGTKSKDGLLTFGDHARKGIGEKACITKLFNDGILAIRYDDTGNVTLFDEDWLEAESEENK